MRVAFVPAAGGGGLHRRHPHVLQQFAPRLHAAYVAAAARFGVPVLAHSHGFHQHPVVGDAVALHIDDVPRPAGTPLVEVGQIPVLQLEPLEGAVATAVAHGLLVHGVALAAVEDIDGHLAGAVELQAHLVNLHRHAEAVDGLKLEAHDFVLVGHGVLKAARTVEEGAMLQQGATLLVHLLGAHPTLHGVLNATARQLFGLLGQQVGGTPVFVAEVLVEVAVEVGSGRLLPLAVLFGFPVVAAVLADFALAYLVLAPPRLDTPVPFRRHQCVDHRQRTHRMRRLECQPALALRQATGDLQVGIHLLLPPHNVQQGILYFFCSIHNCQFCQLKIIKPIKPIHPIHPILQKKGRRFTACPAARMKVGK